VSGASDPAEPRLPAGLTPWPDDSDLEESLELTAVEVRRPRWSGLSLTDLRLEEVSLDGGDLSGSRLIDPRFRDVIVREANLANAVLRAGSLARVEIVRCRMTGITLTETELRDTAWRECSADLAMLRHATLSRVSFDACTLRRADFMGARCDHVRFRDCDLTGASFSHAQFTHSEFLRCRLDQVEGVEGLRGTSMDVEQMLTLAPVFAAALGISQTMPGARAPEATPR
jgi:uncharacterized protein YjbI with pentapeptide repeats